MSAHGFSDNRVLSLPLKTKFRGIEHRELIVLKGEQRWAEFSPFVEYEDAEASSWLKAALSFANEDLPEIHRETVGVNATLPAVNGSEILTVLGNFPGFRTVKIKVAQVGQPMEADLNRINTVHENFPNAKIRLDANGGFTVAKALELAMSLRHIPLEYFEQPVATISELLQLREQLATKDIDLKIAADESIRKATDPILVAQQKAADIAVLKVQPLGGIHRATEIAKQAGLEVVVSSALESSLGIAQGAYFAASLKDLNYDCGLWTQNLLAADIVAQPLRVQNAMLEVRVPELDLELLDRFKAPPAVERFWRERLERCLDLL